MLLGAPESEVRGWAIRIAIHRGGTPVFSGDTSIGNIKRSFDELASYLFRSQKFPNGAMLLTGTGIVPPDEFTLAEGDVVEVEIPRIGVLRNPVVIV